MAPKRFKKSDINEDNSEKYKNLLISDVLCPICRSIFIEPVTLPCNHGFCLSCFNGTMENTTLTCPLCRIRIGSWLRSARKSKNIINVTLWGIIQVKFAGEIRKKLDGEDVIQDEEVSIQLADPGEIRREYEIELQKDRSDIKKQREAESKASQIVIKQLLEEEQNAVKIEEETLRLDEEIARRLSKEASHVAASASKTSKKSSLDKYLITLSKKKPEIDINKNTPVASSSKSVASSRSNSNKSSKTNKEQHSKKVQSTSASSNKTNTLKSVQSTSSNSSKSSGKSYTATIMCQTQHNKKLCSKAYKHLLLTKTLKCERATSNGSDSGDSIKQEMRYFKPIMTVPKSTAKTQDGIVVRAPTIKVPTIRARSSTVITIRSPHQNMTARIRPHTLSAFARCSSLAMSPVPQPAQQPSIVSDSGKVIKQYYNRKRNIYAPTLTCTITSTPESPFLGFERENITPNTVHKMNDIVNNLADNIPAAYKLSEDIISKPVNYLVKKTSELNLNVYNNKRKSAERSARKVNGCTNQLNDIANNLDLSVQEELDLEYAKRLHEELNNPRIRQTRASVQTKKSIATKTRSSPRKRQTTLDELITPKKFKI